MIDLNNLIDLLPYFYKENDTYKDANGKGLLQRFLEICGGYFKENPLEDIDKTLDILKIDTTPDLYLNYFWDFLGSLPFAHGHSVDEEKFKAYFDGTWDGEDQWQITPDPINPLNPSSTEPIEVRTILKYAVSLFKIRGTEQFFNILFKLYNMDVTFSYNTPQPILQVPVYDKEYTKYDLQKADSEVYVERYTEVTFNITMDSVDDIVKASKTIESFIDRFVPFWVKPKIVYTTVDGRIIDRMKPESIIHSYQDDTDTIKLGNYNVDGSVDTVYINLTVNYPYEQTTPGTLQIGVSNTTKPDNWADLSIEPTTEDHKTFLYQVPIIKGNKGYWFRSKEYPEVSTGLIPVKESHKNKAISFKPETEWPEDGEDVIKADEANKVYIFSSLENIFEIDFELNGPAKINSTDKPVEVICRRSNGYIINGQDLGDGRYSFTLDIADTYYFYPEGYDYLIYTLKIAKGKNNTEWISQPEYGLDIYNGVWEEGTENNGLYSGVFMAGTYSPWKYGKYLYVLPGGIGVDTLEVLAYGKLITTINKADNQETLSDGNTYFKYPIPLKDDGIVMYPEITFRIPDTNNTLTLRLNNKTSREYTTEYLQQLMVNPTYIEDSGDITIDVRIRVNSNFPDYIVESYKDKVITCHVKGDTDRQVELKFNKVITSDELGKVLSFTGTTTINQNSVVSVTYADKTLEENVMVFSEGNIPLSIRPDDSQKKLWEVSGETELGYTDATFDATELVDRIAKFTLYRKNESATLDVSSEIGDFITTDPIELEVNETKDIEFSCEGSTANLHLKLVKKVIPEIVIKGVGVSDITETSAILNINWEGNNLKGCNTTLVMTKLGPESGPSFTLPSIEKSPIKVNLTELIPDTQYTYEVYLQTIKREGDEVAVYNSNKLEVIFMTEAEVPVVKSVKITSATTQDITYDSVKVSVEFATENIEDYDLKLILTPTAGSNVVSKVITSSPATIDLTDLDQDTNYSYLVKIQASKETELMDSNILTVSFKTPAKPVEPEPEPSIVINSVTHSEVGINSAKLLINYTAENIDGYQLTLTATPNTGSAISIGVSGSPVSLNITGLDQDTSYTYQVKIRATKEGKYYDSNIASDTFKTEKEPEPVIPTVTITDETNVSDVGTDSAKLNVYFTTTDAEGYNIYMTIKPNIGSEINQYVTSSPVSVPLTGLSQNTDYTYDITIQVMNNAQVLATSNKKTVSFKTDKEMTPEEIQEYIINNLIMTGVTLIPDQAALPNYYDLEYEFMYVGDKPRILEPRTIQVASIEIGDDQGYITDNPHNIQLPGYHLHNREKIQVRLNIQIPTLIKLSRYPSTCNIRLITPIYKTSTGSQIYNWGLGLNNDIYSSVNNAPFFCEVKVDGE